MAQELLYFLKTNRQTKNRVNVIIQYYHGNSLDTVSGILLTLTIEVMWKI